MYAARILKDSENSHSEGVCRSSLEGEVPVDPVDPAEVSEKAEFWRAVRSCDGALDMLCWFLDDPQRTNMFSLTKNPCYRSETMRSLL